MINIGQYIETAINWLTEHFASFFDALSMGIGGFIDGFQHVLFGIPFYITIAVLAALAWLSRVRDSHIYPLGFIAYLRHGLLGRNDADIGIGTFFHLSGIAFRRSVGNLDCQQ